MNPDTCWSNLRDSAQILKKKHLSELLSDDTRFDTLSFSHDGVLLDLSRQRLLPETVDQLVALAEASGLKEKIDALIGGARVNITEDRAALHTALRTPAEKSLEVDGVDVVAGVQQTLQKMDKLVSILHSGQWRGYNGEAIDTVVNIGVGGSDLGPLMTCHALEEFKPDTVQGIDLHFVSSMDGSQLSGLLSRLNPATTLFVLSSKSFTTIDTLANAATARQWLLDASGLEVETILRHHFIGITAQPAKACEWGIPEQNQLLFWDWTGGRYSMWSAIGLPIAIATGMDGFRQLLAGAHSIDTHYQQAPFKENLPVLLALAGIWNINLLDIHAHAILPYDGRLAHLPSYLEQLEMESNGKSVTLDGADSDARTCPVLWGEIGPNAQHAFYQLLHQGTEAVMCDFIVPAKRYTEQSQTLQEQHRLALANCLAQARVLALGDKALDEETASAAPPWKRYRGNQPSTVILVDELTPYSLGQLIAIYEHKVYTQAVIWQINPFDQWGVELGKKMATAMLNELDEASPSTTLDSATRGLLGRINRLRHDSESA
ncbi:glucose-6-phosphate isomerase [Marinobacterium mangrovicola]|uniref:Glucose-6-phosphate isomerase n=1 Tax=Marinobacterium mangrovicola TaxID=1476959 RepID=A0A4R1GRG5_9GAMM|nr:glucose-6-phosphate isomerase [Marinobacterium mangrovicola]TCK07112.1 glucose-6-phosphate isomerase [Marinobacterium mangrovicola]